jgi:hypothetical protein
MIYYEGVEWKGGDPPRSGFAPGVRAALDIGVVVGLIATLVCESLSIYGLQDIWIAQILLFCVWLLTLLAFLASDYLHNWTWKRLAVAAAVMILLAAALFLIDRYATRKRETLLAESAAPVLHASAPGPSVPIIKTPTTPPMTIRQDHVRQTGSGNVAVGGIVMASGSSIGQIGSTTVQQPEWGNLKERLLSRVQQIRDIISQLNMLDASPHLESDDMEYRREQATSFYVRQFPDIKNLRDECAGHNLRSNTLDEFIGVEESRQQMIAALRAGGYALPKRMPLSNWDIEPIADVLEHFAEKIP